jgi:hypothetical protein
MNYRIVLLGISLVAVGFGAHAQPARNAAERASDHAELRQDRRQQRDDLVDLSRLESLARRFDDARERGDDAALVSIEREIRVLVDGELREGASELAGDRREVRADRREVGSSRRELRRDVAHDQPAAVRADDRRDLRVDRRDLRDDVRDARVEAESQERRRAVVQEMRRLMGRLSPSALDRKRQLLDELIVLARAETGQNDRERREDRRELREDRRETREDRRQD